MAPSAVETETVTLPVHPSYKGFTAGAVTGDYKEIGTSKYSEEVEKKGIEGHAPASVRTFLQGSTSTRRFFSSSLKSSSPTIACQ